MHPTAESGLPGNESQRRSGSTYYAASGGEDRGRFAPFSSDWRRRGATGSRRGYWGLGVLLAQQVTAATEQNAHFHSGYEIKPDT